MAFTIWWKLCVSSTHFISKTHPPVCALLSLFCSPCSYIRLEGRSKQTSLFSTPKHTQNTQSLMSTSLFLWDHPMGSSRSGSSHRNDEDCSVDEYLVETLEGKRNSVIRLMNDAEEKQFKDQSVKKWLVNIKHALYDANALLDKIDTEARFREKYKEDGSRSYSISGFVEGATSKVKRIIETLENMVKGAVAMGLKARDEGAAASDWQTRVTGPVWSKSTIVYGRGEEKARILKQVLYSPINKAEEKQFTLFPDNIREWLVSIREWILKKALYSPEPMFAASGNKPEVIAIVGMGGLGKTTLAQYVYNHPDVERGFTRSWACVSDNFDLVRVTRAILESLTKSPVGVCELASLQQQVEEQLKGKRFLIVLDDAWEESQQKWEKLMAPFSTGAAGSKFILTTRSMRVAGVVPADHSFQLKSMSKDEAWSLFSCEVFGDGELSQHPKLEAIGKEIVKKCEGLPLAIKTLSGLLRSERKQVEWEKVRESSLWQLPEGQKDIIPALGLSYSYLSSHLKTCFAYCSLFPKDYEFKKEELVNLWIDEGFLQQPNDNRSIEDVGVASFEDLSSRSFFTHSYQEVYVMHDLIHDLAQMVLADFHLQLNGHKAVKECKKVRHVSFRDHSECSSSSILEDLNQAESLQTFTVGYNPPYRPPPPIWVLDNRRPKAPRWGLDDRILEDVLLQQLSLRVLCLRGARIRTLPDTISSLMLLRCLDVSYTDVEELPASLCKLYNLRRLLCQGCDQIKEFHNDMAAFVSLRHFTLSGRQVTLSGRQLQKAPWNLSQVQLEFHLRNGVGDGSDSSGSRDTKEGKVDVALDQAESDSNHTESGLPFIVYIDRSTFGIRFDTVGKDSFIASDLLESLRPHRDVKQVCIENFDGTEFPGWLVDRSYRNIEKVSFIASDLLESLRPHRDVKQVCIENFNGTEFPGWLVDRSYRNIEKVTLIKCWISSGLMPALGGLPSLKHLQLRGVRNVKQFYSTVPFGSLEELRFSSMEEWEEWEPSDDAAAGGGICFFPRLQKLHIENCPKLKGRLPSNLPSLEELHFTSMYEWEEWEPSDDSGGGGICFFPRLQKLSIKDCPKLKGGLPSNLPSLKMLHIQSCSSVVELNGCHRHRHRQVVDLEIIWCGPRLANSCMVDMRLGMFPHLQRLGIGDCDSFESFPVEDSLPTSLTYLHILRFTRLKKLDVFGLRSLTNLEELEIWFCPLLESLGYSSDVDDNSSDDEFPFNSSLRKLWVCRCENMKTINGVWLRSFTSLRELMIYGCVKLEALPEEGLPRSLITLRLWDFKNIRRQDWIAIQNLTSLEELSISFCKELKDIPVKLPCSLKVLTLWGNHRDLKERCKRDTGSDWPNIAHVPDIEF